MAATSKDACHKDLNQYPPVEVAQSYAALLKTEKLPREAAFWSHYCVGRALGIAGEIKKAESALRAMANLPQSAKERITLQSSLGFVLLKMNHLDDAETALQAALAAAREIGDISEQATQLRALGGVAYERKRYDQALTLYTHSLTLLTDEREKAVLLNEIAVAHGMKGDYTLTVEFTQ